MPTPAAERVRTSLRDDFGNALSPQIDDGTGPCRHCLDVAAPGDRLILFSYRPFEQPSLYQEVGPVFVHADGCTQYSPQNEAPPYFLTRPLLLRPYTANHHIQGSQRWVDAGDLEGAAREMLGNPDVQYLHARSQLRGCYMFRVERG